MTFSVKDVKWTSWYMGFSKEESKYAFINNAIVDSVIETGVEPDPTDRILTLSTCKGSTSTRWVVHARLKMLPVDSV